jgi:hypothetical protein
MGMVAMLVLLTFILLMTPTFYLSGAHTEIRRPVVTIPLLSPYPLAICYEADCAHIKRLEDELRWTRAILWLWGWRCTFGCGIRDTLAGWQRYVKELIEEIKHTQVAIRANMDTPNFAAQFAAHKCDKLLEKWG